MANDQDVEGRIERLESALKELVAASTHLDAVLLPVVRPTGSETLNKEALGALAKLQRASHQAEEALTGLRGGQ